MILSPTPESLAWELLEGGEFDRQTINMAHDRAACAVRHPLTEKGPSRSGRYHISDPYLRFYFRFLESRQEQLALGIQEQALAEISKHMIDFIGTYT